MIHCQTARRDQFEKMAKYNMVPSIFTGHVNYWGDVHMKNFGPVRVNPLKVDPVAIKDIKVLETIKDGETVYAL